MNRTYIRAEMFVYVYKYSSHALHVTWHITYQDTDYRWRSNGVPTV